MQKTKILKITFIIAFPIYLLWVYPYFRHNLQLNLAYGNNISPTPIILFTFSVIGLIVFSKVILLSQITKCKSILYAIIGEIVVLAIAPFIIPYGYLHFLVYVYMEPGFFLWLAIALLLPLLSKIPILNNYNKHAND